jgi:glycosyltransferase involved in cell wall biosynthesis
MRILIAPHEICGQMQLLASTFREMGHDALSVAYNRDPRGYPSDVCLNWTSETSRIRKGVESLRSFQKYSRGYDVLHMFYGRTFLPRMLDLPLLAKSRCKVFVHFRGVEILSGDYIKFQRQRLIENATNAPPLQREHQAKRLQKWRRYADGMFVSEPDLLRIAPEAKLVQQAIDIRNWQPCVIEKANNKPIRIVHPPSSRWKKGTSYVLEAVEQLKKRGHSIELILVENTPHSETRKIYESADIAVDQLLVGWHGNVSIEFMALGKPVICYIDPELRHHRPDLPIANATPATITDELEKLILDKSLRESKAAQGPEYVRRWHDARSICEQLLSIYDGIC